MSNISNISKLRYISLLVNISSVYVALGLLISLQPPFYPSEAELKGAKPSEYGFVFGIANLSLFIFSPIFGKYGSQIGPKLCFNLGAVMQGVSGFLFAFLPYCEGVALFIGLSYLLRFIEGLGTAMAWSSALGILMQVFPNKVASVMSLTQTCFGLGYMLGPAVGAWLYDVGGFMLPFLVVGSISTTLSVLLLVTIPPRASQNTSPQSIETPDTQASHNTELPSSCDQDVENASDSERGANEEEGETTALVGNSNTSNGTTTKPHDVQLGFKDIIMHPQLMMPFVDLFAALCGNGMLESMLEPHLKATGASTLDVGISFLVFGCCYMLGNMFFGQAIDYFGNEKHPVTKQKQALLFSMLGNVLFLTVFIFIGPLPFVHVAPTKELIRAMMGLAGLSYASLVVSSFSRAQNKVLQMGFADDINTYVMISGIWLSAFSLGNFVGPTIAGALVETEGFRNTTLIFFALYLVMLVLDVFEAIYRSIQERRQMRYDPID